MRSILLLATATVVGAYGVDLEDVTIGGYVCGHHQTARVYFPASNSSANSSDSKFPVISFAHGYNNPGKEAWHAYSTMLTAVASAGYVVIVLESSSWPFECSREWEDQIRNLAWAKTSDLAGMIDFSKKTGLLGHSMGGGATYHSAGQASAVKEHNIGAAVALHPQIRSPLPLQPISNSLVPIFFATGSRDSTVSPASVKSAYSKTTGVPKVFSEILGARHNEPMSPPWGHGRHTPYVIAMFDCHLKGEVDQCWKVYGNESDALCSGTINMTDCEHASEPLYESTEPTRTSHVEYLMV